MMLAAIMITDLLAALLAVALSGATTGIQPVEPRAKAAPKNIWLAARYDATRVVIYFDAVQFKDAFPKDAKELARAAADALFMPPSSIPSSQAAPLARRLGVPAFAVGDRYDLLLDKGHIATITLTTIVVSQGDEFVGNDSYFGALATVDAPDRTLFTRDYYAVRRRGSTNSAAAPPDSRTILGSLSRAEASPGIKARIDGAIRTWIKGRDSDGEHLDPDQFPPRIDQLQQFTLNGGGRRYYVSSLQESPDGCSRVRAWIGGMSTLKVLAADHQGCDAELKSVGPPVLLEVLNIGGGRTGIVVDLSGFDGRSLHLLEYRDGVALDRMTALWSIDAGE